MMMIVIAIAAGIWKPSRRQVYGEGRGLDIRLQRTDIFDAMHTI